MIWRINVAIVLLWNRVSICSFCPELPHMMVWHPAQNDHCTVLLSHLFHFLFILIQGTVGCSTKLSCTSSRIDSYIYYWPENLNSFDYINLPALNIHIGPWNVCSWVDSTSLVNYIVFYVSVPCRYLHGIIWDCLERLFSKSVNILLSLYILYIEYNRTDVGYWFHDYSISLQVPNKKYRLPVYS